MPTPARPRKARKPPRPVAREADAFAPLPAGTVLAKFSIDNRAVPWGTPMIGKGRPVKDERLIAWQKLVHLLSYTGARTTPTRFPYPGPVEVRVVARFRKGPLPDATNILKAVEDAIQGSIIVNDNKVIRNSCERTLAGFDRVTIEVRAAEPTPDEAE